ncbi:PRC-barrel domain-containing protein [Halopelagius longus]|uniref:PRC-barrel domain containing protein n=1 Tax=Halopelagius longus TaxID=1236180 RepID=A0A1H1G540_9EURY|nr:PRC-barrel domain-containing protein [Halopelagius longus]RDI69837.1 PRC-barrel domain containing protein [Halopelagius longus]SDR08344.1 Sporulation protein YlmC, PRC-barrel domain family [Halopelagius longus]
MTGVLRTDLLGTPVVGSDGSKVGTLRSVTMDVRTGELRQFLVDSESERPTSFERNGDGYLVIPASRAQSLSEHLVVERGGGR